MRLLNCSVITSLIFSACLCDALLKIPDDVRASLEGQEVLETRKSLPHGQQEDRYNAIRERILESKRIPPQVKLFAKNLPLMDFFIDCNNRTIEFCSQSERLDSREIEEQQKAKAKSFFRRVLNDGSELGKFLSEKADQIVTAGQYEYKPNLLIRKQVIGDSVETGIEVCYVNAEDLLSSIIHETAHGLEFYYYEFLKNEDTVSKLENKRNQQNECVSIFFELLHSDICVSDRATGILQDLYCAFVMDCIAEVVDKIDIKRSNVDDFKRELSPILDVCEKDFRELDSLFISTLRMKSERVLGMKKFHGVVCADGFESYKKFKEYIEKTEGYEEAKSFLRDFEAGKLRLTDRGLPDIECGAIEGHSAGYNDIRIPIALWNDERTLCISAVGFIALRVLYQHNLSELGLSFMDNYYFRCMLDEVVDFYKGDSKALFSLESHNVGFYNAFHFMRTDRVREIIEAGGHLPVEYIFHALTTEEEHIPVTEENVQEFYDYLKGKVSSD